MGFAAFLAYFGLFAALCYAVFMSFRDSKSNVHRGDDINRLKQLAEIKQIVDINNKTKEQL